MQIARQAFLTLRAMARDALRGSYFGMSGDLDWHPTFIKAWRQHVGLSQEVLADRATQILQDWDERWTLSHASLSRIERSLQPYNQAKLEAIAIVLGCTPTDLLTRHPKDPEGIWSIWDQIKPARRRHALQILKAFSETP